MDQNINNSKCHIWNSFFWKYYFRHTTFLYSPRCSSGHLQSFFLSSGFLAESLKASNTWQKRSPILQDSFNRKTSVFLRTLTHLTLKIICSRNTAKNICITPFLDAQERNFWSTLKANVCIFLYISVRIFFQRRSNILSDGSGLGEGWIISWSGLIVWFFFILTEIFENLLFFSILTLPSTALKRWNIPDKLDYKVKIVAKFLIRSHLLTV